MVYATSRCPARLLLDPLPTAAAARGTEPMPMHTADAARGPVTMVSARCLSLNLRCGPGRHRRRDPVRALPPTVLSSFVGRCKRLEYCSSEVPTYSDLTDEANYTLFSRIIANHGHVLQPLLSDRHSIPYSLRERSHNKTLLNKSIHLNDDDFLVRMLYKDSY